MCTVQTLKKTVPTPRITNYFIKQNYEVVLDYTKDEFGLYTPEGKGTAIFETYSALLQMRVTQWKDIILFTLSL